MKSQRIEKPKPKKRTVVINDKTPQVPPPPAVEKGVTLRTVHFVEMRDMEPEKVQLMVQELNATYNPAEQGIHFVIPVRDGKIGTDIVFEQEFLDVVNEVCEVVDGEIQLKGGARDVKVVREKF